jgi:Histidine kinase-, DNA gyrase B-, and HSP90-like ATPase
LLVRADPIHLQQVVLNLAMNGMDAMTNMPPDARMMTIKTTLPGGTWVEVSVSGSGTGIPEHKHDSIFDTFHTTKERGAGLGLSIARTIIETYEGKIWAENQAGGGAVFRFTLPLIQAPRSDGVPEQTLQLQEQVSGSLKSGTRPKSSAPQRFRLPWQRGWRSGNRWDSSAFASCARPNLR